MKFYALLRTTYVNNVIDVVGGTIALYCKSNMTTVAYWIFSACR